MRAATEAVYGSEDDLAQRQARRYGEALAAFRARYGPGPVALFRAPGRVNLIGEHTDYSQGYVLPAALDRDILLLARPRGDAVVRAVNREARYAPRTFVIGRRIPAQPVGDWANYLQGPAELLARQLEQPLSGMDVLVCGKAPLGVPRGAGLASSSALTVAMSLALVHVNGLALGGAALAEMCSRAEWYVGTRGGIMDHFCAVLAQRGSALFLDCRPSDSGYHYAYAPVPDDLALVILDSGERHRNTGPLFNQRVVEVRLGVHLLRARYPGIAHLRDMEGIPWEEYADLLPEQVLRRDLPRHGIELEALLEGGIVPQADSLLVRRRCRHVVSENARVLATVAALQAGDLAAVGELLAASHSSARDDYEISTPRLDALVARAREHPGVVGARLTGAGWGGCVVALARRASAPDLIAQVGALATRAFVCRPAAGAGLVGITDV